eukprot:g3429.t1
MDMDTPKKDTVVVDLVSEEGEVEEEENNNTGENADSHGCSKEERMTDSPDGPDYTSILECPVCFEHMMPPIYQCPEGHLICNVCRPKLKKCPTCRGVLGNIRNRAIEQCVAKVVVPCSNSRFGCDETCRVCDMKKHLEKCTFGPYKCPRSRSKCQWEGSRGSISEHLHKRHNMKIVESSEIDETYSNPEGVENAVWEGPILRCFDQEFILHFEQRESGQYFVFVRFVGPKDEAKKFKYKIKVERHGRSLTWEGIPRSIRSTVKSVESVNDCFVLEKNMALFFSKSENCGTGDLKDLRLRIRGSVTKMSNSIGSARKKQKRRASDAENNDILHTPKNKCIPVSATTGATSSSTSYVNARRRRALRTSARQNGARGADVIHRAQTALLDRATGATRRRSLLRSNLRPIRSRVQSNIRPLSRYHD